MADTLHVKHCAITNNLITVVDRDVWFGAEGISAPLTQDEYRILASIDGFVPSDPPCLQLCPKCKGEAVADEGGPCGTCEGEGFLGEAVPLPGDTDAPLEGEAPEPTDADLLDETLAFGEGHISEETPAPIAAPEITDEFRANWGSAKIADRLATIEANAWSANQYLDLYNLEGAGKANAKVLDALDRKYRAALPKTSVEGINQALVKASAPQVTEE